VSRPANEALQVSLSQALQELSAHSEQDVSLLGGGTDFYPALGEKPMPERVLDVTRIAGLSSIQTTQNGWTIGATATWTDIIQAPLPPMFDGLKAAAREVGSVQIQNCATIGGNLCNASPAADGVPALLCLNAQVQLSSVDGVRTMALADFIRGPRTIDLRSNEILTGVLVPRINNAACSVFHKLGSRRYLVISIVMVSVVLAQDEQGVLTDVRIAVGSCSAVAQRLSVLEQALCGQSSRADLLSLVTPAMLSTLTPIDDVRGSAEYRRHAARQLVVRAVADCLRLLPDTNSSQPDAVSL